MKTFEVKVKIKRTSVFTNGELGKSKKWLHITSILFLLCPALAQFGQKMSPRGSHIHSTLQC